MKEIKIYEIPNIDSIERIDDPYIGMIFYVSDIDTYYSVKTLKEINGINMKGSKVVEYVIDEYADFGTGSGGGSGLTSTQLSNIAKIPAIKATVDALPNNYASKNHNHSEYASSSHRHDASEIDNLPSGGGTGLTTEQAQQLQTAYEHSQSTHVQQSDIPTKTSDLENDSGYLTQHQDLSGYATVETLELKADKTELHTHTNKEVLDNITSEKITEWDNKATESFVTNKIAEAQLSGGGIDTSKFATIDALALKADKTAIPTKLSELENDSNFANQKYVDDRLIEISTSGVITEDITENDICISGSLNNTDIVTDCLEGWWSPAVKIGQTLYDISGKGRNVTYPDDVVISNNKLSPDADGSANVDIDIEPTEILTIEYVVNLTDNANGTPVMTHFYDKSAGMCISIASGRWFTVSVGYDSNSEGVDIPENSVTLYSNGTETGLWQPAAIGIHHVLLRYNSSLSRCEIFIDGQLSTAYKDLLGKKTPVFTVSKIAFNSRGIGINVSDSIRDMDIYDMKIYSKMLSDEEVTKNYNSVKYIIEGQ